MHSEVSVEFFMFFKECQHCFIANIAKRTCFLFIFWQRRKGGVLNAPGSKLILDGPRCILISELSVDCLLTWCQVCFTANFAMETVFLVKGEGVCC